MVLAVVFDIFYIILPKQTHSIKYKNDEALPQQLNLRDGRLAVDISHSEPLPPENCPFLIFF